jgi:hypothetical protein
VSKPKATPRRFWPAWSKQPLPSVTARQTRTTLQTRTTPRPPTEPRPEGAVFGRMSATLRMAAAFLAALSPAFAQDTLDPAFTKIPFDSWLTDRDQSPFQWSAANQRRRTRQFAAVCARVSKSPWTATRWPSARGMANWSSSSSSAIATIGAISRTGRLDSKKSTRRSLQVEFRLHAERIGSARRLSCRGWHPRYQDRGTRRPRADAAHRPAQERPVAGLLSRSSGGRIYRSERSARWLVSTAVDRAIASSAGDPAGYTRPSAGERVTIGARSEIPHGPGEHSEHGGCPAKP